MLNLPIIKIELEGVKQNVRAMLSNNGEELNKLIAESIENTINEDWVINGINEAVKEMIHNAIKDVATNYQLRMAIQEQVSDAITSLLTKK